MYFSQLVSALENPVIQVVTTEDSGRNAGELFDLPFSLFRRWHDYKCLKLHRCMPWMKRNHFCGLRSSMQKEERNEAGRFTYAARCDDEHTYGDKIERLIEAADERMAAHERTH